MKRNLRNSEGFSLVEVVFALGITACSVIIILGLLAAGLGANRVSIQQTQAVNLATAVVADLRQTPTTAAIAASTAAGGTLTTQSPRYKIDVTQASTTLYLDDSGTPSTTLTTGSHYKVTVTFTQPSPGQRIATYGNVLVSWPPATPSPSNSVSAFIALDRN